METKKAESIRELETYQEIVSQGYQPLKVLNDDFELARRDDGACFFLSPQGCTIHAEKGLEAKPAVCKLYPFSLVSTPDGYFVSMAYTCPAVLSGWGKPVEDQLNDLLQTVNDAPHFFPPDYKPGRLLTFVAGEKIDWSDYLTWESGVLQALRSEQYPTPILLDSIVSALRSFFSGVGWTFEPDFDESGKILRQQLDECLPILVAGCLAVIERYERPEEHQTFTESVLGTDNTHSEILDAPVFAYRTRPPADLIARSVLQRYATDKVWGKSLITGPTLISRLLLLAVCTEIFQFYYEARKQLTGELHYSAVTAEWCFDLIETDFLNHHENIIPLVNQWEEFLLNACQLLGLSGAAGQKS